jgi:molybdate transport system ATP-binding protein
MTQSPNTHIASMPAQVSTSTSTSTSTTLATQLHVQLSLEREEFALALDVHLPARGITVLFGPSGSGKTTVLRCVAGLERASGVVALGTHVWQDDSRQHFTPTWARAIGYVFQEASLFEHLNVQANLEYGIKRSIKGNNNNKLSHSHSQQTAQQARAALDDAVALLGIGHLRHRTTSSLSGGERQRVAIARALAMQPKLLLLDEPLASLDMARRQEILPWLERLHTELDMPVLYVTHAMDELTRLADHVVLLNAGRVQAHGPVAGVLSDPSIAAAIGTNAGAILQGVVGEHDNRFHLTCIHLTTVKPVHNSTPSAGVWVRSQDLQTGTAVRLHVHASDVSLATREPTDSSIQNKLHGVITAITPDAHPAHAIVTVRTHEQVVLSRITQRALSALSLQVGSAVWCQIKSVALAGH